MARIRTIKPEFPQSESVGNLSRDARLLFILLWTYVDDEGKCRASSRMLASLLFPYDDDAPKKIDGWLGELELHRHIFIYDAGGSRYLKIIKWLDHQKIDKPSKSRLPDPPIEASANPREPSRTLAPDLGPSTLDLVPSTIDQSTSLRSDDWPTDFKERFWRAYPRRVGKSAAIRKLEAVRRSGEVSFARLLSSIGKIDASDPKFIPHPLTWLNQGRYLDDPASLPTGPPKPPAPDLPSDQELREKYANSSGNSEEVKSEAERLLDEGGELCEGRRLGVDRIQ